MIGVLETTGAYSVKLSARTAAVIPAAKMPAARATALGIHAVLVCIALPPSNTWGMAGDSERPCFARRAKPVGRQNFKTVRCGAKFGCRSAMSETAYIA